MLFCPSPAMLEESQDGMDSDSLTSGIARQVYIQRHPIHGFGFIAGSERPVIVRSVSAGRTRVSSRTWGPDVCSPLGHSSRLLHQATQSHLR